jgi:hypothetical protein
MKHLVLTFLSVCIGTALSAQGNLQFNQIKMVTTVETVPANKAWKVESVVYNVAHDASPYSSSNSASCGSTNWRASSIEINGVPTKVGQGSMPQPYSNVQNYLSFTKLPLWLPAGYTLSGGPCNLMVNVIEFNIAP